jgi:hypothetical protein
MILGLLLNLFRLFNAVQHLAKLIGKDFADLGNAASIVFRGGVLHLCGTQRDPQQDVTVLEALWGHV